jgi:hypothetical protein
MIAKHHHENEPSTWPVCTHQAVKAHEPHHRPHHLQHAFANWNLRSSLAAEELLKQGRH